MNPAMGIDFGTSNSTAGLVDSQKASHMLPLEGESVSMPTCLFFNTEQPGQMQVSFGREALKLYRERHDGRLLRALKSVLGTSLWQDSTLIGYKALRLNEVLTLFMRHLRQAATDYCTTLPEQVVIGRPVHFIDDDARADQEAENQLRQIAQTTGFKHVSFQYEPVAAALSYEATLEREEVVLVADIGGGTSDFTIIRLSPQARRKADRSSDILACAGVHVGGTDLDRQLSFRGLMPELGLGSKLARRPLEVPVDPYLTLSTWHKINLLYTARSRSEIAQLVREAEKPHLLERLQAIITHHHGHALLQCVENAKIALSDHASVRLNASRLQDGLTAKLSRTLFESSITPQLEAINRCVTQVLAMAGAPIDTLFFTGGSSLVPALRTAIRALVPSAHVIDGDPVAAVGQGLTIEAARRYS